jgi:hypothetical protein
MKGRCNNKEVNAASEVCTFCKHFDHANPLARKCAAFPKGIPLPIWLGENDHREPFPGDHGIRFAAVTVAEVEAKLATV